MLSVFVIESVGANDLVDRRSEGRVVAQALELLGMPCVFKEAMCKDDLFTLLEVFVRSGCSVLHLSCHGNDGGVGLTNGDYVSWNELFTKLEPFMGSKHLFLSSCSAVATDRLVRLFETSDRRPFEVVGSPDDIEWRHAHLAWSMIYSAFCLPDAGDMGDEMTRTLAAIRLATECEFVVNFWIEHEDTGEYELRVWKASEALTAVMLASHPLLADSHNTELPSGGSNEVASGSD